MANLPVPAKATTWNLNFQHWQQTAPLEWSLWFLFILAGNTLLYCIKTYHDFKISNGFIGSGVTAAGNTLLAIIYTRTTQSHRNFWVRPTLLCLTTSTVSQVFLLNYFSTYRGQASGQNNSEITPLKLWPSEQPKKRYRSQNSSVLNEPTRRS